jgi:hypothetical protein
MAHPKKQPVTYRRACHRVVAQVLDSLNTKFLAKCACYFGGGTQIALRLDEFRESRDIDFLCSDRAGFRRLRETVTNVSLGSIVSSSIPLAREVRADRDGIRTFFSIGTDKIKFEILLEARIDIAGDVDKTLRVPALDANSMAAEKFLALTDCGMDEATFSRDLIDLAFLAERYGIDALRPGKKMAEAVYGRAVPLALEAGLLVLAKKRSYRAVCVRTLAIEEEATLDKGLTALKSLLAPQRRKPRVESPGSKSRVER